MPSPVGQNVCCIDGGEPVRGSYAGGECHA